MQGNERKRILTLVENGTISAKEALVLLENLEAQKEAPQDSTSLATTEQSEVTPSTGEETHEEFVEEHDSSQEFASKHENAEKKQTTGFEDLFGKTFNNKDINSKVEDLMKDLKEDLTDFGSRMSTLFNTTFSKIKVFENDMPFGEKMEFRNAYAFNAEEVNGVDIDVPNGKVEVVKTSDAYVSVDVTVKTTMQESEEQTKNAFLQDFIKLEQGKLTIQTLSKFSNVQLKIAMPEQMYDIFFVRSLNSRVDIDSLHAKIIKAILVNGSVTMQNAKFEHADLKTKNGSIEAHSIKGEDLEVETANGRIYIDGELIEVEAESINGNVVVTTRSEKARKLKAITVAGAVEIYVPKTVALDGKLTTNFGKIDLGLADISEKSEEESLLQKVTHFDKIIENAHLLKVVGDSKSGSVLVRYTL